jgi:hypothetical protein
MFADHNLDRNRSTLRVLDDFHWHGAELRIDSASPAQWTPIIEINLHRPPHRDPARDRQTFAQHAGPGACLTVQQCLDENEAGGQEHQTDEQTGPALFHQATVVLTGISRSGTVCDSHPFETRV